ncbi:MULTISPECIES: hypothetical protein [Rhodopirellula]|uniref:hypothetical protein n=1 Tax=Rhodopirellula TaxID=265488 RepID=UPI002579E0D1|nr:hypothetical protein [Rhodopirellula sp. UBA1907]
MTKSQRAMMAAKATEGRTKGRPPTSGENRQICPLNPEPVKQSDAAKSLGVSTGSVKAAISVRKNAAEEVADAVDNGEISLNAASQLAKSVPDKEEQKKAVAGGKKASIRNCNPSSVNKKTIGRVTS